MFNIKFKDSNATVTADFDNYLDLLYFVADKKIKDEDFVSINLGDSDIEGIDGLCAYTKAMVTEVKAAQKAAEEAMEAEYQSEDGEEYFDCDDCEDEDCENCPRAEEDNPIDFDAIFGEIEATF
jgi:hypothetical protein